MRAVLLLCACAAAVCGQNLDSNRMARMPKYDERYDYLDVDALFNSKRLVRNYVDCLINAQRCTPEGKQLKRILPEALRTKCIRCTERQKKTAVKVIKRLKYEFPEEWAKLSSRWDPTGDFTRYFEEFLANESFNTISGSADGNDAAGPSSIPPVPPRLPAAPPSTPPPLPVEPVSTSPKPVILNRFGDDGELMMGSPSSAALTPRPSTARPPLSPTTARPPPPPPPRPTQTSWVSASSDAMPTRFPLRPTNDIPRPYTTAITFIDQIGYKIIRTTELVTDILKNTVRAVVGR
ncbi:formin-1-like isoform X1 [Ostrinia furnacalis]|uniref:formin-1-like isoform X1 n=1 Tax=Ostrinia furnacalis TaxID=93504 RepID=UPI00103F910E|nr:formin-1-like isoform X1 [Ostrinia furnacalis]